MGIFQQPMVDPRLSSSLPELVPAPWCWLETAFGFSSCHLSFGIEVCGCHEELSTHVPQWWELVLGGCAKVFLTHRSVWWTLKNAGVQGWSRALPSAHYGVRG